MKATSHHCEVAVRNTDTPGLPGPTGCKHGFCRGRKVQAILHIGLGRAGRPWPENAVEISPEELRDHPIDAVILQRPHEMSLVTEWTGRAPGRDCVRWWRGRGPTSTAKLLAAGPKALLTFADPSLGATGPPWPEHVHERRRWCALVESHGIVTDPNDVRLPKPDLDIRPGSIVIHPGAKDRARQWPPERFTAVARELSSAGSPVVITGGRSERGLARSIAEEAQAHLLLAA